MYFVPKRKFNPESLAKFDWIDSYPKLMGGYNTGDGGGMVNFGHGGGQVLRGGNGLAGPWWGGVPPHPPPILGNPGKKILLGKLLHGMKNDHVKIYCCPKSMTIYRN